MRRARIDANQPEIVKALRWAGATVAMTHMVGSGFPDIVVGLNGKTVLMEIKDGSLPPSRRRLTPDETAFHDNWLGSVYVVESVDDAFRVLDTMRT